MNEVRAEVFVAVAPAEAFASFTQDVEKWWRRGDRYGGSHVVGHRFEPCVGGRFVEVLAEGENELGTVTVWEPPHRLVFTWRQSNWLADELTAVEVRFNPSGTGTRVVLRHGGFDAISSDVGCDVGYRAGWRELLSWYVEAIDDSMADEKEKACT